MISRRKLLTGAAALAAYSALPNSPAKAAANVIAGAIRWDAWYSNQGDAHAAQNSLGPQVYQYRAPWFSQVLNQNQISSVGTQANMDTEIQCAANAGLKYWAFDQFNPAGSDGMFVNGWNLYQSSSKNNLINWCWMAGDDPAYMGSTSNFSTQVAAYVAWFQQSNYQKVLANRPLFYLNFAQAPAGYGGSNSNYAAFITALRTATTSAGLGTPYVVVCGGVPTSSNFMTAIGADAISAYLALTPTPAQPNPFSALNASVQGFWTQMKNTGAKMIPSCVTGWDTRPRKQNPVPWQVTTSDPPYAGLLNYVTPGMTSEIASQIQAAVSFVGSNASACETTAILIYSWTECDEGGGCLIPTLGDPPQVGNTSNVLTAVGSVLN